MGNHDWIWIWSIAYRNHWLCCADSKLVRHRAGSTSGDGSAHCDVSSTCGDIGSCCTDCKLQHGSRGSCCTDCKLLHGGCTNGDGSAHCDVSSTCGDIGSCCTDCKLQHHCGGRTSGDVSGTCHYSLPILH